MTKCHRAACWFSSRRTPRFGTCYLRSHSDLTSATCCWWSHQSFFPSIPACSPCWAPAHSLAFFLCCSDGPCAYCYSHGTRTTFASGSRNSAANYLVSDYSWRLCDSYSSAVAWRRSPNFCSGSGSGVAGWEFWLSHYSYSFSVCSPRMMTVHWRRLVTLNLCIERCRVVN